MKFGVCFCWLFFYWFFVLFLVFFLGFFCFRLWSGSSLPVFCFFDLTAERREKISERLGTQNGGDLLAHEGEGKKKERE